MGNKYYKWIIKILLMIIGVLYFIFLYMDLFNIETFIFSDMIKFICIILCFIISILTREHALCNKDVSLLQTGLFITILADLFLLILDNYYILGITLFCIVQIIYSIRYEAKKASSTIRKFIIIFLAILIGYTAINIFIMKVDFLFMIGSYYAICLLTSLTKAIKAYKYEIYPNPNGQMIALGMTLFLMCDVNVALYNIIGFISLTGKFINLLYDISSISMWLFYLPSQVLLSLSGYKFD